MDAHSGVMKRMRKGTHSCLACRRRKIKCIFPTSQSSLCNGCASRSLTCVPQGRVDDDGDEEPEPISVPNQISQPVSNDRTARLESLMQNVEHFLNAGQDDEAIRHLKSTLPDITPRKKNASGRTSPASDEQPMENGTAPLMRLLDNPLTGRAEEHEHPSPTIASLSIGSGTKPAVDRKKQKDMVHDLLSHLPGDAEAERIFQLQSSWWLFWRDTLGLVWGGREAKSLKEFAAHALHIKHPCLLGLLLVSFAISTNQPRRFLPPVERWIFNDDEWAGTEHGVSCLMASSICYMNYMQPRRAWITNRRAISLLQLNGLHHTHRRSDKQENLFWQIFHSDRWISLTVGMPYSMPDHFCDLHIASQAKLGTSLWLYRQLAVLSGRVIDALQGVQSSSMSTALEIDEKLDTLRTQLPQGYLELSLIANISDAAEKHTRLYRVVHWHQLRTYIYLPLLLRSRSDPRYEFGRKTAVDDSLSLLEAYLMCFDSDPDVVSNGSVLSFTAFIATIIVVLNLMGYGRNRDTSTKGELSAEDQNCWRIIYRTLDVLRASEVGMSGTLCRQCRVALESLVHSARTFEADGEVGEGGAPPTKTVVLPYFGAISISRARKRQGAGGTREVSAKMQNDGTDPETSNTEGENPRYAPHQHRQHASNNPTAWNPPDRLTSSLGHAQHNTSTSAPFQPNYDPSMTPGWNPQTQQVPVPLFLSTNATMDPFMDLCLEYNGPYMMPESSSAAPAAAQNNQGFVDFDHEMVGWENFSPEDWSWLSADLPPSMTF